MSSNEPVSQLVHQLISTMAHEVRATNRKDLERVAEEAATATGLRRAVWATLTEEGKAAAVRKAVERGTQNGNP